MTTNELIAEALDLYKRTTKKEDKATLNETMIMLERVKRLDELLCEHRMYIHASDSIPSEESGQLSICVKVEKYLKTGEEW